MEITVLTMNLATTESVWLWLRLLLVQKVRFLSQHDFRHTVIHLTANKINYAMVQTNPQSEWIWGMQFYDVTVNMLGLREEKRIFVSGY
jgi:hypothetical protein